MHDPFIPLETDDGEPFVIDKEIIHSAHLTEVITKEAKRKLEPVYTMGSPDPRTWQRDKSNDEKNKAKICVNFMGGCDYKIYIDGEQFNLAQAISVSMRRCYDERKGKETKERRGSLIIVGGPGMEQIKEFLDKDKCHIKAEAKDEFGHVEVSFDEKVRLDGWGWGVSIDDIVTETTVEFTVLK